MAIFMKKDKDELRLQALIDFMSKSSNVHYKTILKILQTAQKDPQRLVMQPVSLYTYCVEMMMANQKNFKPENFEGALNYGEKVYRGMFTYEGETPDQETLILVMTELFDEDSIIAKKCFEPAIFNLFTNKHNYVKWVRALKDYWNLDRYNKYFLDFGSAARGYYVDEDMFTAAFINFSIRALKVVDVAVLHEEEMKKISHMMGVYNVDEERIAQIEKKLDSADVTLAQMTSVMEASQKASKMLDSKSKETCERVTQVCETEILSITNRLDSAEQTIRDAFEQVRLEQRNSLVFEKNKMLNEILQEAEKRLADLKKASLEVANSTAEELLRFQQDSTQIVSKLDNYIANEGQLKKLLDNAEVSDELMKKVEAIRKLDSKKMDVVKKSVEVVTMAESAGDASNHNAETNGGTTIVAATIAPEQSNDIRRPDNYYLDEKIDFKARWNKVLMRKKEMAAEGEYFHKAFDDILTAVMENANPYLIGPSGCGKTYMISQIAKLLEMEFIDIGYINEEYDILGFQTANGGYSRPNFYRCYKYGMIAFCDELDNGNARATVKLNSFLSNTSDASYSFPNGEKVSRHPNFRMIAAGNTTGNGADSNYNTREKIEESVQQRMMPIVVGYDNEVEKKILKGHEDWYEMIVLFRMATDAWSKGSYADASGIITTRDAAKIKKYLENESFSEEKIINYEFIQTKDDAYLAFLSEYLSKQVGKSSKSGRLVKMFCDQVRQKLNK